MRLSLQPRPPVITLVLRERSYSCRCCYADKAAEDAVNFVRAGIVNIRLAFTQPDAFVAPPE
jgi:hypothetical protein